MISARQPVAPQPRTDYTPRQPEPAPAPVPVQRAQPGFRFGDESVAPAPAPAPAPVAPVQPQSAPVQQVPIQPQPAPAPIQQPVQMGGRPQANVAPQAEEKAQKSAKPWFMFGKDGQ